MSNPYSAFTQYELRHLPGHMFQAGLSENLYGLARDEAFLQAQSERLPEEPDASLRSIQTALNQASEQDAAARMAEFCLRQAQRLVNNERETPLQAFQANSLKRAWRLADLTRPKLGLAWHVFICWELFHTGRQMEMENLLRELLGQPSMTFPEWTTWPGIALAEMSQRLPQDQVDGIAQRMMEELREVFGAHVSRLRKDGEGKQPTSTRERPDPFTHDTSEVARLARAGDYELARRSVEQLSLGEERARALALLAHAQIMRGDETDAWATLREAVAAVQGIKLRIDGFDPMADSFGSEFQMRIGLLCQLGDAWAAATRPDFAAFAFNNAVEAARTLNKHPNWKYSEFYYEQDVLFAELAKRQAAAGLDLDAVATADSISAPFRREETLSEIACSQAGVGAFDRAFQTLAKIKHEKIHGPTLARVIQTQAATGSLPLAKDRIIESLTKALTTEEEKQREMEGNALSGISRRLADRKAFEQALAIAERILYSESRSDALGHIAACQAEAGLTEAALATLQRLPDCYQRNRGLRQVAVSLARVETFEAAIAFAEANLDESHQARVFAEISFLFDSPETAGQSRLCFSRALDLARRERDNRHCTFAFDYLVDLLCQHNRIDEAARLDEQKYRSDSLRRWVQKTHLAARNYAALKKAAEQWPRDDDQLEALREIALAQFADGCLEDARSTLATAVALSHRRMWEDVVAASLTDVAGTFAKIGDIETARKYFKEAERKLVWMDSSKVGARVAVLRHMAETQAEAGLYDDAKQTSRSIAVDFENHHCLVVIAREQARAGHFADAFQTATSIGDLQERAVALAAIAKAQVTQGLADDAIRTSQSIHTGRDEYLPDVAEAFAARGDRIHFKHLLQESSLSLAAGYKVCGMMIDLYLTDAVEISEVVVRFAGDGT